MRPYQGIVIRERVIQEHKELEDKIEELRSFVNPDENPMIDDISFEQSTLLKNQLYHMQRYSKVLSERIKSWK